MATSPPPSERAARLAAIPFLAPLSREQLEKVAVTGVVRTFHPGESVVRQGERGVGLYLVLSGRAELRRSGQSVGAVSAGQHFGGSALLGDAPRTTEVFAITEVQCFVVNRWNFWGAVGIDPQADPARYHATVEQMRTLQSPVTE